MTKRDDMRGDLRSLYSQVLPAMVELAFEITQPKHTFIGNWHIRHVCQTLRDLERGDALNVVINLPPRTLKTFICSVVFPVYCALHRPGIRIMHLSGHHDLMSSIRAELLKLVSSPQLHTFFPELKGKLDGGEIRFANGSTLYLNVYERELIGRGYDLCIIDDPQSPQQMRIKSEREKSNAYFDESVSTRRNGSATAKTLIVQQRLHQSDLSGHVMDRDGWTRLRLPAIATHDMFWGKEPHRYGYAKGEALFPAMESRNDLAAKLKEIGGVNFRAQYQQSPTPGDDPQESSGYWYYVKSDKGWKGWTGVYGKVSQASWLWQDLFATERTILRFDPHPMTPEEWELLNDPTRQVGYKK